MTNPDTSREAVERARADAAEQKYQRECFGLNNEGDPIGGDPPIGWKSRAEAAEVAAAREKVRGYNHWEALRSIRQIARETGYLERIIQGVNDAGQGYMETAEQTLSQEMDRRMAAEAERDALKAKLAVAVKHMTERFLNWPLPYNFSPDGGITFEPISNKGTPHEFKHQPSGTNLLDYSQAKAMVEHMLEGLNADTTPDPRIEGWNAAIEAAATTAFDRVFDSMCKMKGTRVSDVEKLCADLVAAIRSIPCPYTPKEALANDQ